jgi:4-amino-4-deoxy-L-arabinose transferase-like glycosyltransferase
MKTLSLPLAGWPVVLLCGLYLLAGLIGHDPWKTEDAVHLGVAYEFATHGNWLVPRLAAEPWFGSPPLYHWCAALLGKMLGGLLPFHAAARLASALFGALLLSGVALAARALQGAAASAWSAPLLVLGTLGLLVPIHDAEPVIALMAAQAFVYYGITALPERTLIGGGIAGIALGGGVLAMGSVGALFLLPVLIFPLVHSRWRSRAALGGLALALLVGMIGGGLWPAALALWSPESLDSWWKVESTRLVVLHLNWTAVHEHLELLGWAAWPILPLGLWTLWNQQRRLSQPQILIPLLGTLSALVAIVLFADPQPLHHLPLIVPLALLAASGVDRLRRGAANALDWFGMMTFTLLAGLAWLGGITIASGMPEHLAKSFNKVAPDFVGSVSPIAFGFAGALTLLWLVLMFVLPRSPWRGVTHWAIGVSLIWSLLAALWLPWLDYGKSYRPVAASLQAALGNSSACIAAQGVGDGQKASLRYFNDIATLPLSGGGRNCPWLLVQTSDRNAKGPAGWRKVWEGNRPGDRSERLRLYRRN